MIELIHHQYDVWTGRVLEKRQKKCTREKVPHPKKVF